MESHDLSPSGAPQVSLRGDKSARVDGPPPRPLSPRHPKVRVRTEDRWWPSLAIGRGVKMRHNLNTVSICLPAPLTYWESGWGGRPARGGGAARALHGPGVWQRDQAQKYFQPHEQNRTGRGAAAGYPRIHCLHEGRDADRLITLSDCAPFSINITARLLPHVTNANPCNRLNLYNSPISGIQLDHITATTENSREHKNVNLYLWCSRATELIWETELRQGFSSVPACSAHICKC